jgi:uncharacterized SAM-binding protein YcdF (DUF218 family)
MIGSVKPAGRSHYNDIRITQVRRILWALPVLALAFVIGYLISLSLRIEKQSVRDEAKRSDMIIVMGAAEYRGRPSPVLRARLDHALELYRDRYAPLILTTGGAGGDPKFTEAEVGRSYLIDRGIPPEQIVVENQGETTAQSLAAAFEIMQRMGLRSCIVVSDGYHIFRAKKYLQAEGLTVFGSPRVSSPRPEWKEWWDYLRQAVGFALWQIGLAV